MKIDKPKYESPIEERLGIQMQRDFHDSVECVTQKTFRVGGDTFRADFFLTAGDETFIIEADGREYHDYRKDQLRDMRTIDAGIANNIIRFCGADIFFDAAGCTNYASGIFAGLTRRGNTPPDLPTLQLVAMVMTKAEIRPILRMRHPLGSAEDHLREIDDSQSMLVLCKTNDCRWAILQLKSPYFDRKHHGTSHAMQIADYLAFRGITLEQWMVEGD